MSVQKKQIKALLWDMDGLFIDTEELHFQAWQWMVAHAGGEPLSLHEYMRCVGKPGHENIETICTMKGIAAERGPLQLLRRQKYDELRKDGTPLIEDHIELAHAFKKEFPHLRHILVSSSSREDVDTNLKLTGLQDFFEQSISYSDNGGMVRKPAPDMYLYTLRTIGLTGNETLAFEDSASGVISASKANIPVVALPNRLTVENDFSLAALVLRPLEKKNPHDIWHKLTK